MKEYLLILRRDFTSRALQPSPQQLQESIKKWQAWFFTLTSEKRLAVPLQRWDPKGRFINSDKIESRSNYPGNLETIGGIIFIKAIDYNEATELAKVCPVLDFNGSVEIRQEIIQG